MRRLFVESAGIVKILNNKGDEISLGLVLGCFIIYINSMTILAHGLWAAEIFKPPLKP